MKYAFAREYLNNQGLRIFSAGKQILTPVYSTDQYLIEYPGFWVKGKVELERNITSITTMKPLNDLGFGVASVAPPKRFRKKQRVLHVLVRLGQTGHYLPAMPRGSYVKYDVANKQLKLIGPNAGPNREGSWVKLVRDYKERETEYESFFDKIKNKDKIIKEFNHSLFMTEKEEYIEIEDLPFMISDANEIVCISSKLKDEPRIGVFGGSGTGKSTAKHTLIDRGFWYWGIRPVIMHDSQVETTEYGLPNEAEALVLERLNEVPRPLPTVYLCPNTESAGTPPHFEKGVGYKMTLPYGEIITNSHIYFEDLRRSAKFFIHKKQEFLDIVPPITIEKIKAVFRGNSEQHEVDTPPSQSINKVVNLWKTLEAEKVVDVFTGIPSEWTLENQGRKSVYNPVTTCMLAGLVPIIVTEDLYQREYFTKVFQYYANDIFNRYDTSEFKEVRVWLDIDELHDITKKGKTGTLAADSIISIQRKGRQRGIGTIIATQFYSKCPTEVVANCDHILVFRTIEAQEIRSDYSSLSKMDVDTIQKLGVFECMAYTDKHFMVYDMDGNKREERGPIFGKVLPPLSVHMPPGGKKGRSK